MDNNNKPEFDLMEQKLSRRKFIQASGALGMASAVPGILVGSVASAATPSMGGHLRVAMVHGSSTDSLDPIRLISAHTQVVYYSIHSTLTEIAPNGQLVPYVGRVL